MANLTLNIYGENDEIIKTYETQHIRWKLFIDAVELNDTIKGQSPKEQLAAVGTFIKSIFSGLTDAEIELADARDIFNVFKMVVGMAQSIKGGEQKNG